MNASLGRLKYSMETLIAIAEDTVYYVIALLVVGTNAFGLGLLVGMAIV